MSAVDDVHAYLEAQSLAGGATGWSLLRRRIMDEPALNQLVIVSEDGGTEPEIKTNQGIGDSALADPAVLVTVRANPADGDASKTKAVEIHAALHGLLNTQLGAATYLRVRARTSEPIFAGFDDQGRPLHTIGFMLLREQ